LKVATKAKTSSMKTLPRRSGPAAPTENYCEGSKLRCIFSTSWSMLKLDGR
jgi:hypothetical protein